MPPSEKIRDPAALNVTVTAIEITKRILPPDPSYEMPEPRSCMRSPVSSVASASKDTLPQIHFRFSEFRLQEFPSLWATQAHIERIR
jgi:hypothetical protein